MRENGRVINVPICTALRISVLSWEIYIYIYIYIYPGEKRGEIGVDG